MRAVPFADAGAQVAAVLPSLVPLGAADASVGHVDPLPCHTVLACLRHP
jgi:hypothetical protein